MNESFTRSMSKCIFGNFSKCSKLTVFLMSVPIGGNMQPCFAGKPVMLGKSFHLNLCRRL